MFFWTNNSSTLLIIGAVENSLEPTDDETGLLSLQV